jgi:hypothetical protein
MNSDARSQKKMSKELLESVLGTSFQNLEGNFLSKVGQPWRGLNRIIILSASNPEFKTGSSEENDRAHQRLRDLLHQTGENFEEILAVWPDKRGSEKSFVVVNLSDAEAQRLCREFRQAAYFRALPDKPLELVFVDKTKPPKAGKGGALSPASAAEELKALGDMNLRLAAVSEDIHSGALRFSKINSFELAELVGVEPFQNQSLFYIPQEPEGNSPVAVTDSFIQMPKAGSWSFQFNLAVPGNAVGSRPLTESDSSAVDARLNLEGWKKHEKSGSACSNFWNSQPHCQCSPPTALGAHDVTWPREK